MRMRALRLMRALVTCHWPPTCAASAPTRKGKVTYTDTWLWDKSGHFQLDTLTEGQH